MHIYGPEVHFDRGHALALNLFDWNGVPVRAELVQRLADRNNISLGLGTLSNIVYPENSTDLAVSPFISPAQCFAQSGVFPNATGKPRMTHLPEALEPLSNHAYY